MVIAMFNQEPDIKKMGFLASFFKTPPNGFTDAEYLEYEADFFLKCESRKA
jgi:hypothetical protein